MAALETPRISVIQLFVYPVWLAEYSLQHELVAHYGQQPSNEGVCLINTVVLAILEPYPAAAANDSSSINLDAFTS